MSCYKYSDIIKEADLDKRNQMLTDFYRDYIGVGDWLTNNEKQKVEFNDRTEYKFNNKYHRVSGPAIEFREDTGNSQYYIGGIMMSQSEWKIKSDSIIEEYNKKMSAGK